MVYLVCNDIPHDIPERDSPRTYFVRIDPRFRALR